MLALAVLSVMAAPPALAGDTAPAAVFLPASVSAAGPVRGDVDDFSFQSMDADYTLTRADDGTSALRVVETFVAVFPDTDQNRGMRRSIPDSYQGQPLFPHLVSITDENGAPRASATATDDGFFQMTSRADGFVHGPQTYVFTYTLRNVTWAFADTGADELYWNINGVYWSQPFGRVSVTLHLDAPLAQTLTGRQACYRGPPGSSTPCDIVAETAADGATTVTATASELGPRQTMTIAVGFEKGTFSPFDDSYLASPWGWWQGAAGVGMLAALGGAVVVRWRTLRDEPGRPTIIAEYDPPPGLDALQSAVLLGRKPKAIPAELLEQAVAGSIRILECDPKLLGGYRMRAELVDRSRADVDGRMLLEGLFGTTPAPGASFLFGRADPRLSSAVKKILAWAEEEAIRQGLRRMVPGATRAWPVLSAIAMTILITVFGVVALASGVNGIIPILMILVAVLVVCMVVLLVARRPLTRAGAQARDHLRGLKEFIEWAEADRIRMLQSPAGAERVPVDVNDPRQMVKLYETLLPYAVVFGQEKKWAAQLAVMYGPDVTPTWYAGTDGFNAAAFSSGIGSLSVSAASTSSSSGGSTGGGSAGGGGGGGGGGGV